MTKALTARRERAAERLEKQVENWRRQLNNARSRLAKLAADNPDYTDAEEAVAFAKKKLKQSRQTLANTRANLTPGSEETKQYVREQTLRATA